MHMVAPLDKHFSVLYVLLKEHIADDVDYKVQFYFTGLCFRLLVRKFHIKKFYFSCLQSLR